MTMDVTLTDVQDFVVREVATSAEFSAFSTGLIGTNLNFYRGADLSANVEELPYFVSYKFNSQDTEGADPVWIVQYIIGIDGSSEGVADGDGIVIYDATDKVEQLAVKALGIIRQGILSGGLKGVCGIRISDVNILITEVGEADDVQAIVTLRLEAYKTF